MEPNELDHLPECSYSLHGKNEPHEVAKIRLKPTNLWETVSELFKKLLNPERTETPQRMRDLEPGTEYAIMSLGTSGEDLYYVEETVPVGHRTLATVIAQNDGELPDENRRPHGIATNSIAIDALDEYETIRTFDFDVYDRVTQ